MSNGSLGALGAYLREQRELAQLSLRELSKLTHVSNAYLSQIERGLHEPSLRVLRALATALSIPMEELVRYERAAGAATTPSATADDAPAEAASVEAVSVEAAIRQDTRLSRAQKDALITVYQSYLAQRTDS
ncbi:MAG TPA: helix-turn-helix transcriptional regulator [Aldersonia sp.]